MSDGLSPRQLRALADRIRQRYPRRASMDQYPADYMRNLCLDELIDALRELADQEERGDTQAVGDPDQDQLWFGGSPVHGP